MYLNNEMYAIEVSDSLKHHGVKGMKWRKRKSKNTTYPDPRYANQNSIVVRNGEPKFVSGKEASKLKNRKLHAEAASRLYFNSPDRRFSTPEEARAITKDNIEFAQTAASKRRKNSHKGTDIAVKKMKEALSRKKTNSKATSQYVQKMKKQKAKLRSSGR